MTRWRIACAVLVIIVKEETYFKGGERLRKRRKVGKDQKGQKS